VVTESKVELRPRRQLVVRLQDDAGDELVLRFIHFYPSHQKTLAPGARVRVRGELRGGFFGREMVHPTFKAVQDGTPLAASLTPVYPSTAQLPQAYLRKAVAAGLARAPLDEVLPAGSVPAACPRCATRCTSCTTRHRRPSWPRWRTTATRPGSA
jgi:ATP-dependent DNA helicase RecG